MGRKREKYQGNLDFSSREMMDHYQKLTSRELVVCGAAALDSALVEILERRLGGEKKIVDKFIGADGNSYSPASGFGARIDLAFLVGAISNELHDMLHLLRKIRNSFAHKVKVSILDDEIQAHLLGLVVLSHKKEYLESKGRDGEARAMKRSESFSKSTLLAIFGHMAGVLSTIINFTQPIEAFPGFAIDMGECPKLPPNTNAFVQVGERKFFIHPSSMEEKIRSALKQGKE